MRAELGSLVFKKLQQRFCNLVEGMNVKKSNFQQVPKCSVAQSFSFRDFFFVICWDGDFCYA